MVDVAQLVRALVCGTRGRGFESHLPPNKMEHRSENCDVFLCPNDTGKLACKVAEGHKKDCGAICSILLKGPAASGMGMRSTKCEHNPHQKTTG